MRDFNLTTQHHDLDNCVDDSDNRDSTQAGPLLPTENWPPQDHSILLSACSSPWHSSGQTASRAVRLSIAIYLTFILAFSLWYDIECAKTGRLFAFKAGNISLGIQVVYYWISSWRLRSFSSPRRLGPDNHVDSRSFSKVGDVCGAPRSTCVHSKRCIAFSIFYTAAVTFPLLVAAIYWLVLFHPDPGRHPNDTALLSFCLINVYGVNAIIAVAEILILSSAGQSMPLAAQVEGVLVIAVCYQIWTVLGRFVTGEYIYPYFDPEYAGWRALVCYDLALLSFTMTAFSLQRSMHGLREKLA